MPATPELLNSTAVTITVMSIIILVITFLLGEYNTEERNGRPRYQDIYETGLKVVNIGLVLAVISLISDITYTLLDLLQVNTVIIQFSILSSAAFILAILTVSTGTFFITARVLMRNWWHGANLKKGLVKNS